MPGELDIFRSGPVLPEGFRYRADVVARGEEAALVERVRDLPFRDFEFHGYTGKRRVVSHGWHRDKGVFGEVVGISLLAPCVFRLRRAVGASKWERRGRRRPRAGALARGSRMAERHRHDRAPLDATPHRLRAPPSR